MTQLKIKLTALFFILVLQTNLIAKNKVEKMDELMGLYHNYGQFSGSVLVTEAGKVIFKKSYGYANREWKVANQPNTKFRIASITKQFTSMLIMQLVEQGKIKLDAKLIDYLPDYRKDTGEQVTIHHLLTHTSGIPSYTSKANFFKQTSRDHYSADDFVKQFCSGDLEFKPGEKFAYNNSGYFLLGAIIEKVSGNSYETMLQQNIFKPLGMNDSGYDHHDKIIENRASGYEKNIEGFVNAPYLDMSLPYAAGAIYSTVEDLSRWEQALYNEKLLSNQYKKIMFTDHKDGYAYGWGVRDFEFDDSEDKTKMTAHSGGINGFSTYIARYVDDDNSVILLNNGAGGSTRGMSHDLTHILYAKDYDLPKRSLAEALYKVINQQGIDSAIKNYHSLKINKANQYHFEEGELNRLGYQLISMSKMNEAVEILKLNAELFSDSANAYDSLAEAYMENKNKKLAILNYEKSLELDSENSNAVAMLEKIKSM